MWVLLALGGNNWSETLLFILCLHNDCYFNTKTCASCNRKLFFFLFITNRWFLTMFSEEQPVLTRTKTTVSSSYSFSQCFVHMLGSPYSYDYEYLGATPRLVVTPLTERAFLSLTSSLQSFHCGALVGPPTTGKSETIGELAKVKGIWTTLIRRFTLLNRFTWLGLD